MLIEKHLYPWKKPLWIKSQTLYSIWHSCKSLALVKLHKIEEPGTFALSGQILLGLYAGSSQNFFVKPGRQGK